MIRRTYSVMRASPPSLCEGGILPGHCVTPSPPSLPSITPADRPPTRHNRTDCKPSPSSLLLHTLFFPLTSNRAIQLVIRRKGRLGNRKIYIMKQSPFFSLLSQRSDNSSPVLFWKILILKTNRRRETSAMKMSSLCVKRLLFQ